MSLKQGLLFEKQAAHWLSLQGINIVQMNYRCRYGEIDLIGEDQGTTIFFEVKYRKNNLYGSPAETVTARKQEKLALTAQHYLAEQSPTEHVQTYRFDVIAISGVEPQLHYEQIKNAFEC